MILIILLMSISSSVQAGVEVKNGEILVEGFQECKIMNNGNEYIFNRNSTTSNGTIPLMFGLIEWRCDGINNGKVVSMFDCATCGIYCVYNQYLSKCRNNTLPLVVGLIISLFLSMLFLLICITKFRKQVSKVLLSMIVYFIMKSDRKRASRIRRYNKITGSNLEVKFRDIKYSNHILMNEIKKKRIELTNLPKEENKVTDEIYAEILYNRSQEARDIDNLLARSEARTLLTRPVPAPRVRYNPALNIVRATAILAAMPSAVYTCDQMLYLKSNGCICYNNKCYDLSTYTLNIGDGETVCFNDLNNERLSIKLNRIIHIVRYNKIYKTSDYKIENKMTWNCYGSGKCWSGEHCGNGYELNILSQNSSRPHGYGCHFATVSCNGMCAHGTSCVWYRWEVVPDLRNMATIYHPVSQLWQSDLTVSYKGYSKQISLNTNNPRYDLNNILTGVMNHMPIQVTTVSYEMPYTRGALIESNNTYYNMDVSPHNLPIQNMIGDIQISTKDGTMTFYTKVIDCSVDSCVVKCEINEPAIRRIKKNSPYEIDIENISKVTTYGEEWISHNTRVTGHIGITFGNVELKELIVEKPHCEVSVVMKYACTSCLESPRIVIMSSNIAKEGALAYESNCTWNRELLSCNYDLYELIQVTKEKDCRITIPIINTTLDINFEYEYRGSLTSMKSIKAETTMDVLDNMVRDPAFYISLFTSLSSFLTITAISTVLIKMARVVVLAMGKKEAQNA